MKQVRKYIIYLTTNLENGMVYKGVHFNKKIDPYEFDGYLGSGTDIKKAIKEFGKENFKRETLFVLDTKEEAKTKEKIEIPIEYVNDPNTYNKTKGGGTWPDMTGTKFSEEHKRKISENSGKKLSEEVVAQRLQDIREVPKIKGWKKYLSEKWNLNHATVIEFIEKYAMGIDTSEEDPVLEQRLEDTENIEKKHGWITELANKWDVCSAAAGNYIKRNFGQIDKRSPMVKTRLQNIREMPKEFGWITKLSEKWEITDSSAGKFTKKHIPDIQLVESAVTKQRLEDVQTIGKTRGWLTVLTNKWEVSPTTVKNFVDRHFPNIIFKDFKIQQRLLDIQRIPKELGWQARLSEQWGVDPSTVNKFVKKYVSSEGMI